MAHELEVWLFADRVGTLALVDGRLNFCYAPGWLSHKDAVALSASLPLQAEPFDDRKTRPFFAGLLPEGQMRRLIAQQFQVSVLGQGTRSGTVLRHALDGGVSNTDSEDGDENRQQVQVQRSPGAALGAVCRRRGLYQGASQTAHSGVGKVTTCDGAQAPV